MNTAPLLLILAAAATACMPYHATDVAYEMARPAPVAYEGMAVLKKVPFEARMRIRAGDSVYVGDFVRVDSLGVVLGGRGVRMRRIAVADIDSVWLSRDNALAVLSGATLGDIAGSGIGRRVGGRRSSMGLLGSVAGAIAGGAAAQQIDDWQLLAYRAGATAPTI